MERAMRETDRRREKQRAYNELHGITPTTIKRNIGDIIAHVSNKDSVLVDIGDDRPDHMVGHNLRAYIEDLEKQMRDAAANLEFETAAKLRDDIRRLEADELGIPGGSDGKGGSYAPRVGRSNEGKPGTRKGRFGKQGKTKWGR
jgi:excinuclease ABC subunit B